MPSIHLDIGSTNSRGWLVEDGRILSTAHAGVGVRDTVVTGSTARIRSTARELIDRLAANRTPDLVVAAGMITSSIGVAEVPHVPAPAGVDDLAAASQLVRAPDVSELPLLLVPGIRTSHGEVLQSDVMRGEETLVLGLLANGDIAAKDSVLNAGSHWKLVTTDASGRVAGSVTSTGGEVLHAVQSATVIGASLPSELPDQWNADWLTRGAAAARDQGLLRAFFCVRLLDQAGRTDPAERLGFLVGAAVGHDLAGLRRTGRLERGGRVFVTGNPALARAWGHLLAAEGIDAVMVAPPTVVAATVAGLAAIETAWRREQEIRRPGG